MITARNISVQVDGKTILDHVSCEIGSCVTCILGPNGAGKSTLLKSLSGGIAPHAGEVSLDHKPLSQYAAKALAKRRAVLGQNLDIAFPFKALDIVMMGRSPYIVTTESRKDIDIADEALKAMDACDLKDRIYSTLSGGEKQRIQIARVLAQIEFTQDDLSERYLFLDEPISALDLKHQQTLRDLLKALQGKGLGIVCIVHDINYACALADTLIMMKNGHIVSFNDTISHHDLEQIFDIKATSIQHPQQERKVFIT